MAASAGILSSSQITSLIQQASAAYQAPANALQAQEKPIEAQVSALDKVESALSGLQSAISGLADIGSLTQRSVTASPSGAVSASVTNAAAPATYTLSGIHLAQAQSLISSGYASASASIGTGSLTIQVGSGSATTVTIASGEDSLSGIAAAIDQANAGVTATVLFDGTSYHLVVAGTATGVANAFTVSGSGGLAGLSYAPGSSGLTRTAVAANAAFSLNGVAIGSGSNTVKGVVPGLTLTLAASGSATVTVSQSVDALDKAANALVSALNTVLSTINQYASYSPVSGGGPLLGDVGLDVVRTALLGAITNPASGVSPNAPYGSLSAIGFGVTSSGTVTLDDAAFQSAAEANYGAVSALLGEAGTASNPAVSVQSLGAAQAGTYAVDVTSNAGGSVSGSVNGEAASGTGGVLVVNGPGPAQGLALQIAAGVTGALGQVTVGDGLYGTLSSIVNSALASGTGSITSEIAGLNTTIDGLNQQIAALQQQAQQQTLILTQQFAAAQATLSQLSTVSNFLSSYFNQPASGSGG
ncbi:MAG TPA: flagellar filament capping protein FliD [Stellaceae bacterium]|nr:flagellar filament capping protein FliD [Stellaceae bacterium]